MGFGSCSSTSAANRRCPRAPPFYVLAECAARSDPTEELAAALEHAGHRGRAGGRRHRAAARACGRCARATPMRSTPPASRTSSTSAYRSHQLDRFLDAVPAAVAAAGAERVILFGHLGDGNVHVNVLGADPDDSRVDDAVLELTLELRGHDQRRARRRRCEGELARARTRQRRNRRDALDQARARPGRSAQSRRRAGDPGDRGCELSSSA